MSCTEHVRMRTPTCDYSAREGVAVYLNNDDIVLSHVEHSDLQWLQDEGATVAGDVMGNSSIGGVPSPSCNDIIVSVL